MNKTRSGTLAHGRGAAGSLVSELSGAIGLEKLKLVQSCRVRDSTEVKAGRCPLNPQRCQVGVEGILRGGTENLCLELDVFPHCPCPNVMNKIQLVVSKCPRVLVGPDS